VLKRGRNSSVPDPTAAAKRGRRTLGAASAFFTVTLTIVLDTLSGSSELLGRGSSDNCVSAVDYSDHGVGAECHGLLGEECEFACDLNFYRTGRHAPGLGRLGVQVPPSCHAPPSLDRAVLEPAYLNSRPG
jgi:hypothetical protein